MAFYKKGCFLGRLNEFTLNDNEDEVCGFPFKTTNGFNLILSFAERYYEEIDTPKYNFGWTNATMCLGLR